MFDLDALPLDAGCNQLHRVGTPEEWTWDCVALSIERHANAKLPDDHQLSRKADLTRDDVPFVEMELAGAVALADDALSMVPEIRAILDPVLHEAWRADQVYDAIYRADDVWRRKSFKKDTASKWEEAVTLAVATGVATASPNVFVPGDMRRRVTDGMQRAGKYYTNEFFNKMVMPALENSVERAMVGDVEGGKAGYQMIRETMNRRLKSVPYWKTVANSAASRSYHYGLLRGGYELGKRTYRFEAVMDERTTDICASLHRREWSVNDGLALMERVAAAEDPEEVKQITPFLKKEQIEGLSSNDLRDIGVIVPPCHHLCRSTLVLI